MTENITDQADHPLPPRHITKPEFAARHSISKPESRFSRLLGKINRFFNRAAPSLPENRLEGRIHELNADIDAAIESLLGIKNDEDPQTTSLINMIVEPLIKEIQRMRKGLQQKSVAQQVKDSKGLAEWTEKANMWIELCSRRPIQKETLTKAVVDHAVLEFHSAIDKDCQVIEDYLNHTLNQVEMDEFQKSSLKEKLEPELSQCLRELLLLKKKPKDLSMETLQIWRAQADLARENYFSAALHAIDLFTNQTTPRDTADDKLDHYVLEITANLLILEERIFRLEEEIAELKHNRSNEIMMKCNEDLQSLERSAHELNSNLRLSHEHVERIQQSMETLTYLSDQIRSSNSTGTL